MKSDLIALLEGEYLHLRQVNGMIMGLQRMAFTTGLFCHLDKFGYKYRYCYESYSDALQAFQEWNGEEHPPGNWIKRKGEGGDMKNPNYEQ